MTTMAAKFSPDETIPGSGHRPRSSEPRASGIGVSLRTDPPDPGWGSFPSDAGVLSQGPRGLGSPRASKARDAPYLRPAGLRAALKGTGASLSRRVATGTLQQLQQLRTPASTTHPPPASSSRTPAPRLPGDTPCLSRTGLTSVPHPSPPARAPEPLRTAGPSRPLCT